MINISWSSILIFTFLLNGATPLAKQGFNHKFLSTRQQLSNTIYQNSKDQSNLRINTSMLWSRPLQMQRSSNSVPTIIRTNHHTIMLNNMDLWVFKDEALHFTLSLKSDSGSDVQFSKAFEWQDRLFVMTCFQNSVCNLYSATSDFNVTYHQPLSDIGDPIDAQFFTQQGKLYLTILFLERAFSSQNNRTNSRLRMYQWHSIYMDPELIPEITSAATCITSFGHKEDVVLVLGCPGSESLKFRSQVWSHKPNGEMILVQYLPTEKPKSINHFMERGENFIIVLEKDRETSVYWWEGSEFVQWLSLEGTEKFFQVSLSSNLKYPTFLTFTYRNVLRIYLMNSVKLDKVYETEFSSSDMEKVSILRVTVFEENDNTYMLVLTKSESLVYISLHRFNIQVLDTTVSEMPRYSDTAQEALDTVFRSVTYLKSKMGMLETISSSVLLTNKDIFIKHGVVTGEITMENGEIKEIIHRRKDISQFINDVHSYIYPITQDINIVWQKLQATLLHENRHLFFLGRVIIRRAKINSLTAHYVNDNILEPRSFLSVTKNNQRLRKMKAKKLKVDWLALKMIGRKKIEDFHLTNSRVNVPVTVSGLESKNLMLNGNMTINNITVDDLINKMVNVVKEEDVFNKISQIGAGNPLRRPGVLKLQDNTVIQNLYVDFVDGIPVSETLTSVFVTGMRNKIYGNVHFQAGVRTNQVVARRFDFAEMQNVPYPPTHMNIIPAQTNIFPPQMSYPPPQVNYPPPQMSIPAPPQMSIPVPPPQLKFPPPPPQMGVFPQLRPQMALYRPFLPPVQPYPQSWAPFNPSLHDGRRMKRETVVPEDTGEVFRKVKVKIIGHLKVDRLVFENSSLVVNNHSLPTSGLGNKFWTRSSSQVINGSVHFVQGISIESSLKSPIVNGRNLSHYATRQSNFKSLSFENIYVDGNVNVENASIWMQENKIKGSVLNVKHLKTEKINGENTNNVLRTKNLQGFGIKIVTENLQVGGNLETDLINDINVRKKFSTAIMSDEDFELNDVEFKTISGDNVKAQSINNHLFGSLMKFSSRENSSAHIHGDIHLSRLSNVSSINSYPANFFKVVNKRKGAIIHGKKKFIGLVSVNKKLKVTNINGVNFDNWMSKLLKLSEDQDMSGFFTVQNAVIKSNFSASSINGISSSNLIYIDQPQVLLSGNIRFKTLEVYGNVTSASLHKGCHLPKVEDNIVFEKSSKWSKVEIIGDSDWPTAMGGQLQHLLECAVTSHGNQTISGNLHVLHLSVQSMQVKSLNDKNITFIFQDSFLRKKENQVISGKKTFTQPLYCKNISIKGDAKIKSINEIDINDIEEKLVRHSSDGMEFISGHKTFLNGFKAFSLICPVEGINGVKAEDIVSRTFFNGEAPPLTVQSLKVYDSLLVETVNDLNLKEFLKDCIYLNYTGKQRILGQLHIEGNIYLQDNVTAPSINNISISDVLFVNNKKKPIRINGCKRFSSDIVIESDPNIHLLNDRNVTKTFMDGVKIDQDVTINGSVTIESEVDVDTVYSQEYFVGPKKLEYISKTITP